MPEQLLSQKTQAQRQAELDALSKATGNNLGTAPATLPKPVVKPAPVATPTPATAAPSTPTPAPANAPATPKPTAAPTPTTSATTASSQALTADKAYQGFDEAALLSGGITQDQIDKMKAILTPQQEADKAAAQRASGYNEFVQKDLQDEQKQVETMYNEIKSKKADLANQALQINNDSAEVQKAISEQEYQKTKFQNEQAQAQYSLDMDKAERARIQANDENELSLRRAIGAQLGAAFGSEGLTTILKQKERAQAGLDDLRASTAIGKAEFAFKAMEIEKNYSNALKSIETDRKTSALTTLSTLNNDLTSIDEQVLMSAQEKKQAARDAVKEYYTKLDTIDQEAAARVSTAVDGLYTEKKQLEKEKLEKETFDLSQSTALGYYANKYGQPIGVPEGGQPKPFVGQYDESLSKQFGFLVDANGRAILGTNGQKMAYRDPDMIAFQNALGNYQDGDFSQGTLSSLNMRLGSNITIANTLQNGVSYPSPKYGKLQCGEYINDQFLASRMLGSDFANADKLIAQFGGKPGSFAPQVGDVVFMDTGDKNIPHKAIVEGMDKDGNLILTDANYVGAGVVRHGWKIAVGDKNYNKIYGFARLPLNKKTDGGQPMLTPNVNGTDNTGKVSSGGNAIMDNFVISYDDYKKMDVKEKRALASQGITEDAVKTYFENKDNPQFNSPDGVDTSWVDAALSSAYGDAEGGKALAARKKEFYDALAKGDGKTARQYAFNALIGKQPASVKTDLNDAKSLVKDYQGVKDALQAFKEAGQKTGLVEGTMNEILTKLKQKKYPGATELATRINSAFANYAKAISGAAVSDSERENLMKQFPSLDKPWQPIGADGRNENEILIEELQNKAQRQLNDKVYSLSNGRFDTLDSMNSALDQIGYVKTEEQRQQMYKNLGDWGTSAAKATGSGLKTLLTIRNALAAGGGSSSAPSAPQTVTDEEILNALK